jgi:hypothetical protein
MDPDPRRSADRARGRLPKRMYVYNYRLFDRYDREVISLAILADDDPTWRPDHYEHGRWGCRAGLWFPVVKLTDYAAHTAALETNPNVFALVVLAHLKTLETRQSPADRHAWKVRLIKRLYERSLSTKDVRQLFRFIDWLMDLPGPLDRLFWQEIDRYEEERRMPFMTTPERLARTEELLAGIELGLELKFGAEGLRLLPEIQQLTDVDVLRAVRQSIRTAATPEDLREIWAPTNPGDGGVMAGG